MESPGAADTKTSRTSVPTTASCDRSSRLDTQSWKLQRWVLCPSLLLQVLFSYTGCPFTSSIATRRIWKHTYLRVLFQLFQFSLSFWVISWREGRWFSAQGCPQTCDSCLCPLVQSWRGPAPSGHCCGKSSSLCEKRQIKLHRDMRRFGAPYFKETRKGTWQGQDEESEHKL